MPWFPRTADDAGVRFTPRRTRTLRRALQQHAVGVPALNGLLKSIDRLAAVRFHPFASPVRVTVMIAAIALIVATIRYVPDQFAGLAFLASIVAAASGTTALNNWLTRATHGPDRAATLVSRGCCGRCAYPLQGLEPDAETHRVACPECGQQWLHDRITHPFWADTAPYQPVYRTRLGRIFATKRGPQLPLGPDHRKRWTPYTNSRLTNVPLEHAATIPVGHRTRFARRVRRPSAVLRVGLVVALFIVPAVLVAALQLAAQSGSLSSFEQVLTVGFIGFLAIAMAAAAIGVALGDRFIPKRSLARHMLDLDRCPTCAAPLDEATPNADGTCTCAHCGAAWRRSVDASCTPPEPSATPA